MVLWALALLLGAVLEVLCRPTRSGTRTPRAVLTDRLMQSSTVLAATGSAMVAMVVQSSTAAASALGAVFVVVGLLGRVAAMRTLRARFQLTPSTGNNGREPVTAGPYRWVRHPGYSALILYLVGVTLLPGCWLGALFVLPVVGGALHRIRVEEQLLVSDYGDAYRAYSRRTPWRLVPGLL
ncbi:isoprenylcysteine carboxylmethyltransferase family protein [Curtobacterium sp. 9128]|uniref:methyltransferase family protein n=1 Tax=Curtobacterium sp. 9128 TaxID=1793722 RepID=UPI0011A707EB|nr:isoprenylcysteine carboxylmethyltransferase family protein [Curtobacterium sp. 9128]